MTSKVLIGFIRDCSHPNSKIKLDHNEPLYIVELGAGSGKFSYFMLKALEEISAVCDFPMRKIVFVMTDFTESNFSFWRNHPSLKKYFDSGQLDAGIFDAVEDSSIHLWKAGITLGPGSCKNPVCVVANYLFDTLYHDIFQVDGGVLKEGLISVGTKRAEEPDPLDPEIIQRMDNKFKYSPISPLSYYPSEEGDEEHFKRILAWYQDFYKNSAAGASLLLPVGAMRALRRLGAISNNKMLVISGDKGNNHPEQFVGLMDPHIALHGSFSLMVNYHAIGAWFTSKGGFALHNPQEEASLKVSCFLLDSSLAAEGDNNWLGNSLKEKDELRSSKYPHLSRAFADHVNDFGPNDFFVLQKSIKEDSPNPPLRTVVALLKLGDWDPDVFFKFRDCILNHAPSCDQKLRNDLCRGIPRVWSNYYMMDMEKDIAFEIGRYYYGIRDYSNALYYYTVSSETVGLHHVTFHNQGLCHYSLGQLDTALGLFKEALALNFDYEKARSWIEKVEREIVLSLEVKVSSLALDAQFVPLAASATPTAGLDSGLR